MGLAVAVRGSNYIHVVRDVTTVKLHVEKHNLNELNDDHVSFHPTQLALSLCGRFLLVATDKARMMVLRVGVWGIVSGAGWRWW